MIHIFRYGTNKLNLFSYVYNIRGGGSSFTLVRQISQGYQAYTTFNFHLLFLIYSFDLLMIIGLVAAWSVPPPLNM